MLYYFLCIHNNIAGIIWGICYCAKPDDKFYISHEKIAEFVRQKFSEDKMWHIQITIASYQIFENLYICGIETHLLLK